MSSPYLVQEGDNLYAIAKAHGVTLGELLAANPQFGSNGRTPNMIYSGEELTIPSQTKFNKYIDLKRGVVNCPATCPSQVKFTDPSTDQPCRWSPTAAVPWKTLVAGRSVEMKAEISPASHFGCVRFESNRPDVATVSPATAASAAQTLALDGVSSGVAEIRAVCDGKAIGTLSIKVLALRLPLVIAQSDRRPGFNADGTVAADMLFGNYSKEAMRSLGSAFEVDDFLVDFDKVHEATLFKSFRRMAADLFAMGDMESVILEMIDRFENNLGGTYSNSTLTNAVRKHASTQRFVNNIRRELANALTRHKGDLNALSARDEIILAGQPRFHEPADFVTGLTITINDTWAYDVVIQEYSIIGDRCYVGKFKVVLYDHFGLDEPDVDGSKPYRALAGFRAWFILQHLSRFGYKPFVTEVVLDGYEFHGTVGS